jgi:integrase
VAKRRKRANGEGTVCRRRDGRWIAAATLGLDRDGRPVRRTVYGRTQAEAREKLDALRAEVAGGAAPAPERATLGEFTDRWLEDCVRPNRAKATYRSYAGTVRNHVAPVIGGVPLRRLSPQHVQAMLSEMGRRGASPRTRQMTYAVLRAALGQAVRWGLVPRNPCDAVDRPRVPRREARFLDEAGVRALLEAARGDPLEALAVTAVTTGMRQGELLGLQWGDVDLKAGTLAVRRQLVEEAKGRPVLGELKTTRSRRLVVLPEIAIGALRSHKAGLAVAQHPTALVFTDSRGNPLRKTNLLRRWYHPLVAKAGLPRSRFHDLRHTHATLLLSQGVHPKVVQERLGHASVTMTLDTYSHVTPSLQAEAAVRLDAALGR